MGDLLTGWPAESEVVNGWLAELESITSKTDEVLAATEVIKAARRVIDVAWSAGAPYDQNAVHVLTPLMRSGAWMVADARGSAGPYWSRRSDVDDWIGVGEKMRRADEFAARARLDPAQSPR